MFTEKNLKGRRIAVLAADGFEKIELTIPVAALKAGGAHVEIISLRPGRIRGVNLHEPAGKVKVTKTVAEAVPTDYDGLFIPGGFINPDLLRQSAAARQFVRAFDRDRKPIATLCHGPWVLASAGLARGRTMTSWPGIRDDMVNAGAVWLDSETVRDSNWLTSRGPQDMVPFVEAVTDFFSALHHAPTAAPRPAQSSPQRNAPPQLMISAMKWIPRPSLRTALGITLVAGAGWFAARKLRGQPGTPYEAFQREPVTAPL